MFIAPLKMSVVSLDVASAGRPVPANGLRARKQQSASGWCRGSVHPSPLGRFLLPSSHGQSRPREPFNPPVLQLLSAVSAAPGGFLLSNAGRQPAIAAMGGIASPCLARKVSNAFGKQLRGKDVVIHPALYSVFGWLCIKGKQLHIYLRQIDRRPNSF